MNQKVSKLYNKFRKKQNMNVGKNNRLKKHKNTAHKNDVLQKEKLKEIDEDDIKNGTETDDWKKKQNRKKIKVDK